MSITERERVTAVPTVIDPRVRRGAELLDERMPGWADRIDVDSLVLAESTYCVLGQIGLCVNTRDYERTARRLLGDDAGDGSNVEKEHGFYAAEREGEPGSWDAADAERLEQDWTLAILSRRQA